MSFRIFLIVLLVAATAAWAQLPPSSVRPGAPGTGQPAARPGTSGAPAPTTQVPGTPAAAAAPRTESSAALPDLSNAVPNTLTPEETAQGWKLLFDGKRLVGLRGLQKADPLASGWKIQNGELTLPKEIKEMDKVTGGDLATTEQFWDFDFRFEWKATVSANSGVRYLVNTTVGQPPTGLEYQIIDDVHNTIGLKGGPIRRSGALDNVLPVGANAKLRSADPLNKQADPWNEGRIVVQGTRVEHWMNGEKVLEFTLGPQLRTVAERNYNREEPFAMRPHGMFGTKGRTPIVIVDQGTEVSFRNLKVRALVPQAIAPASGTTGLGQRTPVPNPFLLPPKSQSGQTR